MICPIVLLFLTMKKYDASKNELTIKHATPSKDTEAEGNVKMLKNVTEEQVTFDPAKYANAKIVDQR